MKQTVNAYLNTKIKRTRKLEPKQLSPTKSKRSKSKVHLPSVKGVITSEHPNYSLGQVLGEGAFAKVRIAQRKSDQLKCVIKMYEKSRLKTEERKKSLHKQIQVLKKISHQSIINLIDSYETSDSYNIVMEYFSSTSLADFAKEHRPWKIETLKSITKQIAHALDYLHSRGMAHRDIKPENILINRFNQIKIIDLGFAMNGEEEEVKIAGTPQYMCPQLTTKKSYDPSKADIWAFGILLYWLAMGYYPHDTILRKKKLTRKNIKSSVELQGLSEFNFPIDINPGLQYLISKMLHSNPKERIQAKDILVDTWVKPKCLKEEIEKLKMSRNFDKHI